MPDPADMPTNPEVRGLARPILLALSDIKISHSVFALPFALLGGVLASDIPGSPAPAWGRFAGQLALIVGCMFTARTWAMLINRWADWRFDAHNPRTARRAIASGRLSPRAGLLVAVAFAAAFVALCALFWVFFANPWPVLLSVPVLAWIAFYSFTKRFSLWCHVFLGGALAASPLAAAVAINPAYLGTRAGMSVWLIAGMVVCWVAGFDVAYALQDLDFDRERSLHSVPAKLGVSGALWISRLLHVAAGAFMIGASLADPRFGWIMRAGVGAAIVALVFEHIVLARRGVAGLPLAFFTLNGFVSLTLGGLGVLDVFVN